MFKNIPFFLLQLILILFASRLFAQKKTDNIVAREYIIDTIYINPDTLYLTDTVFIYDPDMHESLSQKWFSYEITGGLYFPVSAYRINNEIISQTEIFNDVYKPALSYNFGTHVNVYYNKMSLQSGLLFSCSREKVNLFKMNKLLDIQYNIKTELADSFYIVTNNDTTWNRVFNEKFVADSLSTPITGNFYNRVNFINIPLLFGYSHSIGNLAINFYLGGSLCFVFTNTPNKLITPENSEYFRSVNKQTELRQTNMAINAKIETEYMIKKSLSFFIGFGYQGMLKSVYHNETGIKYKPHNLGMLTGFKFYPDKKS